jgi:hypothetical protein
MQQELADVSYFACILYTLFEPHYNEIGFVRQPLGTLPMPATKSTYSGAIEVLNYELARRLAGTCEVIAYSRKGSDQTVSEIHEGVRYEGVTTFFDDTFERHPKLKHLPGLS